MLKDEKWPVARLIPITSETGVSAKERNAASALLAVMTAVDEFGRALLKPLGVPAGRIEAFVEIPFKLDGKDFRPDGLILVARGKRHWSALLEVKVAGNQLERKQMEAYLDIARQIGADAVLSISNQYTTSSSDYPIPVDRKKLKKLTLRHWSWVSVLTEAVVQQQHRGVKDRDQAYILSELIRYLSDPRSGVVLFNDMGANWTTVREQARLHMLKKTDPAVADVADRWDQLVRYLCLDLTKELGRDVKQLLRGSESSVSARQQAVRDSLGSSGQLTAELQIPDAASSIDVVADLSTRQVTVSARLKAPGDAKSRGRVSWLLRQLQKAPPTVAIESIAAWKSSVNATLADAREDPGRLIPPGNREIREFRISLTRDLGLNRAAGRGGFIDSAIGAVKVFYGEVLQNVTAWKPRAPRLPQASQAVTDLPDELEAPVAAAEAEMAVRADSVESA